MPEATSTLCYNGVMAKETVLITVKTYPVLSAKYAELVCTAGINQDGEWRRLYPIQFRQLADEKKYRKYQWIEAELGSADQGPKPDKRPESRRVVQDSIQLIGEPLTTGKRDWAERRREFIDKVEIHEDLVALTEKARNNEISLALFKPTEWIGFSPKRSSRTDWNPDVIRRIENMEKQQNLFKSEDQLQKDFKRVPKLPYDFQYSFTDSTGKQFNRMITDWEIGALYSRYSKRTNNDESEALEKVKQKYWDEFICSGKYSPLLILGTVEEHQRRKLHNQFLIIGVVPLPVEKPNLFQT